MFRVSGAGVEKKNKMFKVEEQMGCKEVKEKSELRRNRCDQDWRKLGVEGRGSRRVLMGSGDSTASGKSLYLLSFLTSLKLSPSLL